MQIGVFTYSKFHGKDNIGSTKIRVDNPRKYWNELYPDDEFEVFKHGKKYDVVIFQKVYFASYAEGLDCFKILDLCDPDWLSGWVDIMRMIYACDVVTVSSVGLYDYLKKILDPIGKPIYYVPDRHDVDKIPFKDNHKGRAKNVLWYGYSHNAHTLRPVIKYIKDNKLRLTAFCNDINILNSYFSKDKGTECFFEEKGKMFNFVKYSDEMQDKVFLSNDFCVLPPNISPVGYFKSNNKDTLAQCYGLGVAKNVDDFKRLLDPKERNKELDNCIKVRKEYDTRETVKQLKEIILKEMKAL